MNYKEILLERANTISGLEKRLAENRNDKVAVSELKEQYNLFSDVSAEEIIKTPCIVIKNDVTEDKVVNEKISSLTEKFLKNKNKEYISFLQIDEDENLKQNFIIQHTSLDEAKKFCENLEKDEFFIIRDDYTYKFSKLYEGKWKPVLQKKTSQAIQQINESKGKHYRILGKKYKALF